MKKRGLKPRYPKRFKVTTDSGHNEAVSPNLLNRQFDVAAPNKGWKTDITYVWALEGGSTPRLLLTYFPDKWWAGPLLATCGLHWVLMPCKWHFGGGNLGQAGCIIRIAAANRPAMNTEAIWG
jgi:hypothetical protein